jgi:DNA (cytosine-5)-methyltransferase 1
MRPVRRTISLFTGVGGLDLGLEAAGFDVAVAVEVDRDAVDALRKNRDWTVVQQADRLLPIEEVSSRALLTAGRLRVGEAALLVGGPPCQPFSKSGYWASGDALRLRDPRANTLREYFRVLRATLPKAFLLENVPGLKFKGKDEGLIFIEGQLRAINREMGTDYVFSVAQLNAADFGVPQLRERVFVVGHREGLEFRFPQPRYGDDVNPFITAWDAIGDLRDDNAPSLRVTGRWAELLPSIPEGHNYLFHTSRGGGLPLFGWRTRYWSFLLKLAKSRPSWTLQAQPGAAIGPFHWANRRLSAKEAGVG